MSLILEEYQRLSDITGKMREAAIAGEWDELITLERRCSHEVASLKPPDTIPVDDAERRMKVSLIKKMLADDKAIRERTEPWMLQLQQIMQSARTEHRMQQAYFSQG
mgnify:FL=1